MIVDVLRFVIVAVLWFVFVGCHDDHLPKNF
jgi:hypothetical protein